MIKERLYTIEDLEALLDKVPYEVWIKDEEGRYIYANKLTAEKALIRKEDIIGKRDLEIRNKEFARACEITDKEVLETRQPVHSDGQLHKGRNDIYYEVYKFIVDEYGEKTLVGGIAKEIRTERYVQLEIEKLMLNNLKYKDKINSIEFFNEILTKLTEVVKCKNVNMFLFNNDDCVLSLYSSSKGVSENIFKDNINIRTWDLKLNENNREYYLRLLKGRLEELYSRDVKEKSFSKVYPIEFAGKILGILHTFYEDRAEYHWNDDSFINEICSKLSNIVASMKLIEEDKENFDKYILENYVLKYEKKRLEESVELEKMKSNLLVNISHEFRTPINILLNSVQLILSLLESNNLSEEQLKKYLNILKQNAYRLTRLVSNVIDVNKINTGFYELELENHNIVNIIEEVVLSTVSYVEGNGRKIVFDTDVEEVFLDCDPEKIERIILNLISNALKFTQSNGEIIINLTMDNKRVVVKVKNDGAPISKEDGKKIFNRFVQKDELLTRPCEGSGLGLYIVKSLVEMHGGDIWVNTDIEEGAEFIFYIPVVNSGIESKRYNEDNINERRTERCNIEFSDVYNI